MPKAPGNSNNPRVSPIPTGRRVTSMSRHRRHIDHQFDDLLDFDTQVSALIWIEVCVLPLRVRPFVLTFPRTTQTPSKLRFTPARIFASGCLITNRHCSKSASEESKECLPSVTSAMRRIGVDGGDVLGTLR
jgi:hypothetical protein